MKPITTKIENKVNPMLANSTKVIFFNSYPLYFYYVPLVKDNFFIIKIVLAARTGLEPA